MDGGEERVHLENSLDLTHARHITGTALIMSADLRQTSKYELQLIDYTHNYTQMNLTQVF